MDDTLFIEQHTEPFTARTTDEAVATRSAVDEAFGELDLDVLTDQLLEDLALAVL